jgi:hypothetical protein
MKEDVMLTTEMRIEGANCPYCLNEAIDRLRHEPGVHGVHASSTDGCLVVEHEGIDQDRLIGIATEQLHGTAVSSNETVMLHVDASVAELHCRHH